MTQPPKMTMGEMLAAAYVAGWRQSLELYSVWKNGEQLTTMGRRTRDEMRLAEENCREYFNAWLQDQKAAYGKEEE